jgi:hypothetical protein
MTCEQYRQQVLLGESGELTAGVRQELEGHLSGCAACRAYRADSRRLAAATRKATGAYAPSPSIRTALHHAAEQQARRAPVLRFPGVQVLAYAAGLLVIVGGFLLLRGGDTPARGNAVEHMQVVLNTLTEGAPAKDVSSKAKTDEALRHLARQLLAMEGLAVEEATHAALFDAGA